MMLLRRIAIVFVFGMFGLMAALPSALVSAQQAPPAAAKPNFVPGLGEFMTLAQTRHAKLWFAGNAGNWALADYEIDELKEGFEDAITYVPTFKDIPVAKMIKDNIMGPIAEVESAVKTRDRTRFAAAFDKLTAGCNACHQAANHNFIVIQRPQSPAFPNQVFTPARP